MQNIFAFYSMKITKIASSFKRNLCETNISYEVHFC